MTSASCNGCPFRITSFPGLEFDDYGCFSAESHGPKLLWIVVFPRYWGIENRRTMLKRPWRLVFTICALGLLSIQFCGAEDPEDQVCRPKLAQAPLVELGKAGHFNWFCSGDRKPGKGFYIVFVRPVGTYVLLKVPQGRTSFEFAPDMPGTWRWIVINTDPDRGKPDVESEPGFFQASPSDESGN
ncbi:MAG: hypothetical protein HY912_12525 [Desulfomonile tiedjei]|uniref:Uncharacterized protein n=1 Tax=Desulfomonile tiedjei TaxID=2358 RepID=A0A9D6V1G2_9BACT|nr:hypothetical protein [Desulfomonile tiedjei]